MASELKVDKFTGVTTAGSIDVVGEGNSTTTNLQQGLGKFWVNFNGTGTIAARDSFNFTSLTDNGAGDYSITIANNMSNTNYAHTGSSGGQTSTSIGSSYPYDQATARTTTLYRVLTMNSSGSAVDTAIIENHIMGDLA